MAKQSVKLRPALKVFLKKITDEVDKGLEDMTITPKFRDGAYYVLYELELLLRESSDERVKYK